LLSEEEGIEKKKNDVVEKFMVIVQILHLIEGSYRQQ